MIAAWMIVSALLGGAIVVGAIALDGVCRALNVSRRWTWVAALASLVVLTVLVPLRRMSDAGVVRLPVWVTITSVNARGRASMETSLGGRLLDAARGAIDAPVARVARGIAHVVSPAFDRWLMIAWGACSVSLLVLGVVVYRRLRIAQGSWPVSSLHGERVHVAPDAGPAVFGFLRGSIVVPPWLVECAADVQQVVLAHEREHVRARDPMLLTFGALAVVLLPWNPVAWWMLARLRLAVELDCDRRVLASGVRMREYGTLLIDLAGRTTGIPLGAPLVGLTMLAERTTHLERRIVAMSAPRPRLAPLRIVAGSLVALIAALAACESRLPTEADVSNMTAVSAQQSAAMVGIMNGSDSLTTYYINDRVAAAAEARALSPEQIASVRVIKRDSVNGGKSSMWISTRAANGTMGPIHVKIREDGSGGKMFAGPIFIDGKRTDQNGMKSLSPNDIVSIEVIKGPRAAALYPNDSAAAQGVIQITTKHGAK